MERMCVVDLVIPLAVWKILPWLWMMVKHNA
jgi:hypothetical protein